MNPTRRLARLLLFLTLSTLTRAAALPRVAVVPDSPEPSVAAFADFLSVSLASASTQYTLVERAELTRLASEAEIQKLAADQRPAALAKLAKADGLIIVGADKGDPKLPKLTLRLTSTHNGLVLRSLILGGKEAEYPKAAELAAGVLRFPCERLTHGDMKPPIIVSLLGIRPAFEIDRAMETTLNLAVAQQLSAQSGIAVSERWKMHDLVFERSLADEKPQSFATGTVLLDGSYTRKGDQLEFSLRLRKAESEEGKTLTLQGPANKPVELAQQIAKLIATEAGQSGEVVPWDAIKEGNQYADLGWWLHKRNYDEESVKAYESAMALGHTTGPIQHSRCLAYLKVVDPTAWGYMPYETEIYDWDELPKQDLKRKLMMAIRLAQVTNECIDSKWGGETLKEYSNDDRRSSIRYFFWLNMKVLQAICIRKEQLEFATEARTLRALSRDMVLKSEKVLNDKFSDDMIRRFYMFDTPEEAAADLRRLLLPGNMTNQHWSKGRGIRDGLWSAFRDPNLWIFVDWNSTDNRQGTAEMKRMIAGLQASDNFLERIDGFALAYQSCHSGEERDHILDAYATFLENHMSTVLTPQGQMGFYAFYQFYSASDERAFYVKFEERRMTILQRVFEEAEWVNPATISITNSLAGSWRLIAERSHRLIVSEAAAASLLQSIEKYTARAKADPRWKSQYQNPDFGDVAKMLLGIPEEMMGIYPGLKKGRIEAREIVAGAVPIRAWKPEISGVANGGIGMRGDLIRSKGGDLLIPCIQQGIIDLDVNTMSVKQVIPFPETTKYGSLAGMALNNDALLLEVDRQLYLRSYPGKGKQWECIVMPGVKKEDDLNWCIEGIETEFFVGSNKAETVKSAPKMLAGKLRGNQIDWLASSNRRPSVNPLDGMDPRNARLAFRSSKGTTMVLMEAKMGRAPLVELESGREVSALGSLGTVQTRGAQPLYWSFSNPIKPLLIAFDPNEEKPLLQFKSDQLPEIWSESKPLHDIKNPAFSGTFVTAIVIDGYLWILKREAEEPGRFEKNDPQGFRLIRVGLRGGDPVVVPLRYEVPPDIRKLGVDEESSLERPVVNQMSFTSTLKGFFFACSGTPGNCFKWSDGIQVGGDPVPALLYITWDDINAWLAKNAPASAKPASP